MDFLIPRLSDIVDILIITVIIYQCLAIMKRTGSYQILYGLLIIAALYLITSFMKLEMVSGLLNTLKSLWVIVVIVLFQPEIRALLAKLNLSEQLNFISRRNEDKDYCGPLIDAVSAMSFRRIGAIIVIENKRHLNEYSNAGEILDSKLSLRLIISIFNIKSVLHDGAIIISNGRIIAAKVVLPLSKNLANKQRYGTRHLAAIGITEVSDAMAIVVSEQTGRVSIASDGILRTDVAFEELMQIITDATK
jgi:diadenylate cyclase